MDNMRELVISGDTYRSSDAMLSQQEERMLESSSVQTIVRTPFLPSRCKRAMIHVAIVNLRRALRCYYQFTSCNISFHALFRTFIFLPCHCDGVGGKLLLPRALTWQSPNTVIVHTLTLTLCFSRVRSRQQVRCRCLRCGGCQW